MHNRIFFCPYFVEKSTLLWYNLEDLGNYQQIEFREVFWHGYAKIPRPTSQNAITEGDLNVICGADFIHEHVAERNANVRFIHILAATVRALNSCDLGKNR